MKHIRNIYKAAFPAVLLFGVAMSASAQRQSRGGERQAPQARAENRPQQQSFPQQGQERHAAIRTQPTQQSIPRNENTGISQSNNPRQGPYPIRQTTPNAPTRPQREPVTAQNFPRQSPQRVTESPSARGNNSSYGQRREQSDGFNRGNNNWRGYEYASNNGRYYNGRNYEYNHYDRRPIFVNRYYYSGGYHPHPYYYRPFTPHFGIRIDILPFGYYPFYLGTFPFYYNEGLFYRSYNGYYETIEPPLGAFVPMLPPSAYPVVISNMPYYEYNGTYYQRTSGATQPYKVVGVNGLLESDLPPVPDAGGDDLSDQNIDADAAPQPLTELPANFKTVTLNNITYYISPSGKYYTKNTDQNGLVTYTVAALENK